MQLSAVLSFLVDVAQTFFSILELLLTRIIPVFAILVVSLLLRIFHLLASLAAGSSSSNPSCSKGPVGERCLDTPLDYDDVSVHSANESDDGSYLEEWSPVQNNSFSPSPVSEGDKESPVSWQGVGPRNETSSLPNSSQSNFPDTELLYPSDLPAPLDYSSQIGIPDTELIYPSDLPGSLDYVERDHKADLHTIRPRTLPPSLSQVEKALRESSGPGLLQKVSQKTLKNSPKQTNGKALALSKSEARFLDRFRRHFLLDQ